MVARYTDHLGEVGPDILRQRQRSFTVTGCSCLSKPTGAVQEFHGSVLN